MKDKIENLFNNTPIEIDGKYYSFFSNGSFKMNNKVDNFEGYYSIVLRDNQFYLIIDCNTLPKEELLISIFIGNNRAF